MNPGLNDVAPDQADSPLPGRSRTKRLAFYQWVIHNLFHGATIPVRVVLWNGDELVTAPGQPVAQVRIHDRATFLQLLLNPYLTFGDAYSDGRVEVEGDLLALLEQSYSVQPTAASIKVVRRTLARLLAPPRPNSPETARENIWHHYDLGNEFYRLWLDEQLLYTCAYFPTETATLEAAQVAKMEHVCRKLWLRPGETVVEAGCGWGSLALHMARHHGVRVQAYNLSREQIVHARRRAQAEGLDHLVEFVEADYRTIRGQFDAFVSVGMLEHVGLANYPALGDLIHRCLKPSGRGLIHTIGRNRPCPTNPWLEKRIFPGAYMPSLGEMMTIFEPRHFSVLDVENLRRHYARTLEHWRERFERVAGKVGAMFDERFVRAWRLYLACSQAGFTSGHIQLFQVVFAPATNNAIPWTRTHVYETADRGVHRNGTGNGVVHGHGTL